MENTGKYKLINYNNRKDCILILEETKTFKVIQNDSVLETGNWHFEVGGDYFIVYLNDKKDQLESGRFQYSEKIK
uniref:hypothetical protein n=1 Tax=Flavobacterium sp. TaxID=239 RepID=UPI004049DCFB